MLAHGKTFQFPVMLNVHPLPYCSQLGLKSVPSRFFVSYLRCLSDKSRPCVPDEFGGPAAARTALELMGECAHLVAVLSLSQLFTLLVRPYLRWGGKNRR